MAAPDRSIRHRFAGGWATDFGTLAEISGEGGRIDLPFLLRAENIYYQLNGACRKVGGTTKYNSSALGGGDQIRGMFEFVKIGTAGSSTRKRVCHVGTTVLKDDNDASFTSIFTGLEDDKVPHYSVFNDTLIIASDSTSDVPKSWDQTTAQNLSADAPNFAFSVPHVNKLWAAGDASQPSRLYYSETLDATTWTTGDGGNIDIDPDDGDQITAIYPHREVLVVFKGPNFGSIHLIRGATSSTFSRIRLLNGVGAIWQNLVFPLPNDVGFVNVDGTIRTLAASDRFGDFENASLSLPINSWLQDNVNLATSKLGSSAVDSGRNYCLIALPIQSSATPNTIIMMDYRFPASPRFAQWTAFDNYCVARMSDSSSNSRPIIYFGGSDGFIRKSQQPTRSIDGSGAISAYVQSPFLHYGVPGRAKSIQHVGLGTKVVGSATIDVSLKTDSSQTSLDVSLESTGDVLGPASANQFTLGTSTLAEDAYATTWQDVITGGDFRSISYELSNVTADEDFEVDTIYAVFEEAATPNYEN